MISNNREPIGVGPTAGLTLRVSVATLARVQFSATQDGELMLALEHKATLIKEGREPVVVLRSQPFGGAVHILNIPLLQSLTGGFHFDSQRSQKESDFRIFIRPSMWGKVRQFCLDSFDESGENNLESDPIRELQEEFKASLGFPVRESLFCLKPGKTVLEREPKPTGNVHASGYPTLRVYRVFQAEVIDPVLWEAMVQNSASHPPDVLRRLAIDRAKAGGRGWANAVLVAPLQSVRDAILAGPQGSSENPVPFNGTTLSRNIAAILDGVKFSSYEYR